MHLPSLRARVAFVVTASIVVAFVPATFAASPLPIEKLSTSQRTTTSPDSTVVTLGKLTTTLGKIRAAHKTRTSSLAAAQSTGSAAHVKLASQPLKLVGVAKSVPTHGPKKHQATPPPLRIRTGGFNPLQGFTGHDVIEPASQYSSKPADMKAFCAAAKASACAYLPPNQIGGGSTNTSIDLYDSLITAGQCHQESGAWLTGIGCRFAYPKGVLVHFKPAASFKLAQAASCNAPWAYTVDPRGAISITFAPSGSAQSVFSTGSNATCLVRVALGQ